MENIPTNERGKRIPWVRWLFILSGPLLVAQFLYGSLIFKPYPGVVLPSFAKIPTQGDSLMQTTQHEFRLVPCGGDTLYLKVEEVFSGMSPIGARLILDRVLFFETLEERLTPERKGYYKSLEKYIGRSGVDYILRNRYPPVNPSDEQALENWLQERTHLMYPQTRICQLILVRLQEQRHLQRQSVEGRRELDRYTLDYE